MNEHIVSSFEDELNALSAGLARMGGLCEHQLAAAIDAIVRRDSELAEKVIIDDKLVDDLENENEQAAVRLIALRQPMANDLRETVGAIKIAADLERVGDLAKNVAKRAPAINREAPMRAVFGLERMARLIMRQLKDVLDAYGQRDVDLAEEVRHRDEEADEMYNSLFRELLTDMMEDPRTIGVATHLLFVAKNLERMGDHATNIAEIIHYIVHGEMPKGERRKSDVTSLTTVSGVVDTAGAQ